MDARSDLTTLLGSVDPLSAAKYADALLEAYGSVDAVLTAAPERIAAIATEPVASLIVALRAVMISSGRESVVGRPAVTAQEIAAYLQIRTAGARVEEVYLFHFAADYSIICDEMVARGSRSRAEFEIGEIVRRALDLGSHSILLAHNHPSGSPKVSPQDVAVTRRVVEAARIFDLTLVDHLIITRGRWTSLMAEGLM